MGKVGKVSISLGIILYICYAVILTFGVILRTNRRVLVDLLGQIDVLAFYH